MPMPEEYLRWLECECDACNALAEISYDLPAWEAQLDACKAACPNWADDDAPADRKQQELFK